LLEVALSEMTTLRTEVKSNNSKGTTAKQQQVPRRPKSGLARDDSVKNQSQKPKAKNRRQKPKSNNQSEKTKGKKQRRKAKAKSKVKNPKARTEVANQRKEKERKPREGE
jgi:hypothetical protein